METAKPVLLKFCVDTEWLQSIIYSQFILDSFSYEALNSEQLRKFSIANAEESNNAVAMDSSDKLVRNELRNKMTKIDDHSRIKILFISY